MKNLQKPVLLPTKDASELVIFPDGVLFLRKDKRNGTSQNQHIYLTSDAPIKEKSGEWFYSFETNKVYSTKTHHSTVGCKKIEFTTDPKLTQCDGKCAKNECVCDLVPAIDGNTKAYVEDTDPLTEQDFLHPVNFLEEFCKRYNKKNNDDMCVECGWKMPGHFNTCSHYGNNWYKDQRDQKVDVVEKFISVKELLKYIDGNEDRDFNLINAPRLVEWLTNSYNPAIQNTGQFSLEDIRNAILWAWDKNEDTQSIEDYLQSITQSQPKEDIVIEYNEKTKALIFK